MAQRKYISGINYVADGAPSQPSIGMIDDNDLIRSNPWLGPERLVKWKDFLKSWELEYTKVVMMEPVTQTRLEVD